MTPVRVIFSLSYLVWLSSFLFIFSFSLFLLRGWIYCIVFYIFSFFWEADGLLFARFRINHIFFSLFYFLFHIFFSFSLASRPHLHICTPAHEQV